MKCVILFWLTLVFRSGIGVGLINNTISNVCETISDDAQLIFAHVVFRHGERNIDRTYPNDPYRDESYWPGGYGALTNVGKQEIYELGQYLRSKYQRLIGIQYSPKKVFIRSTDFDRTLMSGQLLAAGLFPPLDDQVWNHQLNWQPVPIHTIPITQEHLLAWNIPCPRFRALFEQQTQSQETTSLFDKYRYSIDFWEQNAGMPFQKLVDIMYLHDTLYVENRKHLPLPEWANIALHSNNTLEYLAASHLKTFTRTTELKKLEAGTIIKEIFDRFKNKTLSLLEPDRSLWIYAAHDLSLVNILSALDVYDLHIPKYGSSIHFELYQYGTQYSVQILYKKSATECAEALEIPNCGTKCPLDKLYELYKDILPTQDYELMCQLDSTKGSSQNLYRDFQLENKFEFKK